MKEGTRRPCAGDKERRARRQRKAAQTGKSVGENRRRAALPSFWSDNIALV